MLKIFMVAIVLLCVHGDLEAMGYLRSAFGEVTDGDWVEVELQQQEGWEEKRIAQSGFRLRDPSKYVIRSLDATTDEIRFGELNCFLRCVYGGGAEEQYRDFQITSIKFLRDRSLAEVTYKDPFLNCLFKNKIVISSDTFDAIQDDQASTVHLVCRVILQEPAGRIAMVYFCSILKNHAHRILKGRDPLLPVWLGYYESEGDCCRATFLHCAYEGMNRYYQILSYCKSDDNGVFAIALFDSVINAMQRRRFVFRIPPDPARRDSMPLGTTTFFTCHCGQSTGENEPPLYLTEEKYV